MKNRFSIILALFLMGSVSVASNAQSSDFLNSYFENQIPLNNNTFSFSLVGVVIGDKVVSGEGEYSSNKDGYIQNLPELLDANSLSFYGISPNMIINRNVKFNQLVANKNLEWFNSKMPKLEILKNKLVTFNYSDGKNESFLFNVKKLISSEENNNFRKALQLDFATEEVKNEDENYNKNLSGNIIWRVFAIGDESYLALTALQLNRLHLDLFSAFGNYDSNYFGVQVLKGSELDMVPVESFDSYGNEGSKTSGNGIYLARSKDKFMESGHYLNPADLVFLFKLSQ